MRLDMPDTSTMTMEEKFDTLKTAIFQTHGCLESHRDETRASFGVVTTKLGQLTTAMDISIAQNESLAKRLGAVNKDGSVQSPEKVRAAVGAWPMWKLALAVVGSFTGVIGLLKFLFLFAPAVWAGFVQAVMASPT
jgi:hypothetical protein